jgi:hypothetical protein
LILLVRRNPRATALTFCRVSRPTKLIAPSPSLPLGRTLLDVDVDADPDEITPVPQRPSRDPLTLCRATPHDEPTRSSPNVLELGGQGPRLVRAPVNESVSVHDHVDVYDHVDVHVYV